MELGSILLILSLALIVGIFVARPFFEDSPAQVKNQEQEQFDHERSSLLAERDRILNALKELDFDHLLGKIPEDEYPIQRAMLLQKGVEVLKQLDALEPVQTSDSPAERIEIALNNQRNGLSQNLGFEAGNGNSLVMSGSGINRKPDDEIERMLANRRRIRKEKAAGFCPKCGSPIQKSDHFCPKCGYKTG